MNLESLKESSTTSSSLLFTSMDVLSNQKDWKCEGKNGAMEKKGDKKNLPNTGNSEKRERERESGMRKSGKNRERLNFCGNLDN